MNVDKLQGSIRDPALDGPVQTDAVTDVPTAQRPASVGTSAAWLARRTWLWPALLAAVFGLVGIGRPELWRDELRSWSAASRSIGDLVHLLGQTDAAVALYYFILHYWIVVFGDSAASMRMPSVIAMAGAAATVSLIGQRLYDRKIGITAGVLFAIIPNVTRFAQEARPYAMTMFLAGLSTLLLLRAIDKPGPWRFIGYAASLTVLALMQVLMALPLVVVHGIGALIWARNNRRLLWWLTAAAGAGLLLATPIMLYSSRQYAHQVGALPPATVSELTMFPARLFASGPVAGAIIALAVAAFAKRRQPAVFALALAVVPSAAIWLASQGPHSYWMTRYTLVSLFGWVLLAAAGIAALRIPPAAVLAVVLVIGTADHRAIRGIAAHDAWDYPEATAQFLYYSSMGSILAANMRPGDGIVYAERTAFWLADIGVAYHLRGRQLPRDVFVATDSVKNRDFWPVECTPLASCAPNEDRIWVVSTEWGYETTPYTWMDPEKARILQERYTVAQRYQTTPVTDRFVPARFGLVLTLLVRRD